MTDNKFNGFPFSLDEFDEETQMTVGRLSHDLVVQIRDNFNEQLDVMPNKDDAMKMALLKVMAESMLDMSILQIKIGQLSSMYPPLAQDIDAAQSAVELVSRLTNEDPVIQMMLKMGTPRVFDIVSHLEASEEALRKQLEAQENSREKSSEIPTVDSDKL